MAEVRKLLESLGLSQYSEIFERHDIDLAALIDLGEDDLKELGLSLGHRVRLRKAVAALRAQARRGADATWLASTGREREGYGVLELVHARMPEEVDGAEVRAARALLEELR